MMYKITKRGDTIIEVMFAFAIFSLVSIITVTMMNMGVAAAERSLEMTVVRNEMNAQAEALRFVHSSYVAELTLPDNCTPDKPKCQQYKDLWEQLTINSRTENTIKMPVLDCQEIYKDTSPTNDTLRQNNAFVLNTRRLLSTKSSGFSLTDGYIPYDPNLFRPAPLDARIIYTNAAGSGDSTEQLGNSGNPLQQFTRVASVEGIWVVAVQGSELGGNGRPRYYDFHIGTCWNGSGSPSATSLDTIVRLYNPETN